VSLSIARLAALLNKLASECLPSRGCRTVLHMHELARATHTVCHGLSERSDLLDKCRLDRRMGEKHGDKHWKLGLRTGHEILCVARTAKVAKTDPGIPRLAAKDHAKRICQRFRRDCTKLGFRFADKLNVDDGHGRLT